ncbi:hypothetical protein CHS0354_013001 [Potamilus streckersoni]|uniref:SH3 domain-containing protein n=1 Tax=Potamilus streckersoni TaxID=2493646 RepID=A0AAE0W8A8_9BIVA|nr:hypothetical protein CHS0354_013001 [Potamilus streckersoni]
MEPVEDAKIYNIVKNEGLGDHGPVTFLRRWKAQMERRNIQADTMKLYSTAWEKQQSTLMEIEKAKEYYHLRKYKLEYGLRQLQADPPVLSKHEDEILRKYMYYYRVKCENAQQDYKKRLITAEEEREKDIAAMRIAERRFERFEKNRLINTAIGIEKFLDCVEKLDTERFNHLSVIEDIIDMLENMNVEADLRNLEANFINKHEFPVFTDFDEMNPNQQDEIKTLFKKLNLGIRKKNQFDIRQEVIVSDESDPNLVQEKTISDDDSDYIKVITTPSDNVDDNDGEETDKDISEINENGREIQMKHKPQSTTSDVRAIAMNEKQPNETSITVKASLKPEHFLPNAIESDSKTETWAIPKRNLKTELNVDTDASTVPPKLTRKAKKLAKKKRKVSESVESIKPIKESRKASDTGQTEVYSENCMVKDNVEQNAMVMVESTDSDTATEEPDAAEVTNLANVKVIAIGEYTAQNTDELNLKTGQNIKQKIPANSDGMAYGWIRKGKLSRKIYGYYPANLIKLKSEMKKIEICDQLSKNGSILKFTS